jgi:hypothetical protein
MVRADRAGGVERAAAPHLVSLHEHFPQDILHDVAQDPDWVLPW